MIKKTIQFKINSLFVFSLFFISFFDIVEINKHVYPSCKHVHSSSGDGEYSIDPTMSGNPFTVYCDMTTDGGKYINFFQITYFKMDDHSSVQQPVKPCSVSE